MLSAVIIGLLFLPPLLYLVRLVVEVKSDAEEYKKNTEGWKHPW